MITHLYYLYIATANKQASSNPKLHEPKWTKSNDQIIQGPQVWKGTQMLHISQWQTLEWTLWVLSTWLYSVWQIQAGFREGARVHLHFWPIQGVFWHGVCCIGQIVRSRRYRVAKRCKGRRLAAAPFTQRRATAAARGGIIRSFSDRWNFSRWTKSGRRKSPQCPSDFMTDSKGMASQQPAYSLQLHLL